MMILKNIIKAQKLFKVLFLFGVVGFFAYCTSSTNKMASSFSKRKYTKGHFSDPVAKTNPEYLPYGSNIPAAAKNHLQAQVADNHTSTTDTKTNFNSPAKTASSNSVEITKSSSISYKNNVSLKENLPYNPYHHYNDDNSHDSHSSNASTLLVAWLVCLGVALLCLLLFSSEATTVATGASVGAGCLLLTLMTLAAIASIVLFILWIVAIAQG